MRCNQTIRRLLMVCCIIGSVAAGWAAGSNSVYTLKPNDPEAFYFTPENYGFKADGKSDVTDALQEAINQVKREKNFGILFLPEGNYRISKTIQIPSSIRLIGYGKKRPVIYLGADTPGFQTAQNYMIWFTGGLAQEGRKPSDAGAGTFYSAVSNVDFRIDKGNPQAVAIRAHFAQHGFINHGRNIGQKLTFLTVHTVAEFFRRNIFLCADQRTDLAEMADQTPVFTSLFQKNAAADGKCGKNKRRNQRAVIRTCK